MASCKIFFSACLISSDTRTFNPKAPLTRRRAKDGHVRGLEAVGIGKVLAISIEAAEALFNERILTKSNVRFKASVTAKTNK